MIRGECVKEEMTAALRSALETVSRERNFTLQSDTPIQVDFCREERFGDFSTNLALELPSRIGMPRLSPRDLGQALVAAWPAEDRFVEKAEVAGPGFVNFFIRRERWLEALKEVLILKDDYGRSEQGRGQSVQVEFVSANPTGPLHLGHGRGAAVGDILSSILEFTGHRVQREFYINDAGHQVEILARSVLARYRELLGEKSDFPEDGYRGEYISDLAREAILKKARSLLELPESESLDFLGEFATGIVLGWIRKDLEDFGVRFDAWFPESGLYQKDAWEEVLRELESQEMVYPANDALWFCSTRFGDDKDRVVVKRDGRRTYLASDILYHWDKFRRGFERVINVWGADHHGYVPRMEAVVQAFGRPPGALSVRLVQLVTLTRGGRAVAMGKREGEFTTLAEVVREVGKDAARFFFLMRRCESPLEFDLELAKARSADNPVFYVQYAHARISSIFRHRTEAGLPVPEPRDVDLTPLELPEEMSLIKKVSVFPDILAACSKTLEPHQLAQYLVGLAGSFHSYYNKVRVITENEDLSRARLGLVQAVGIVLRNALGLMGVAAPREM
jgi:arginyl-tRNA synthetase